MNKTNPLASAEARRTPQEGQPVEFFTKTRFTNRKGQTEGTDQPEDMTLMAEMTNAKEPIDILGDGIELDISTT